MKRFGETLKKIPLWGWGAGIGCLVETSILYKLAEWMSMWFGTIERAFVPKIAAIDDAIPFAACAVTVYVLSFPFWVLGPAVASTGKKKDFLNYVIGLSLAYVIGCVIMILWPSYSDRVAEGVMESIAQPGAFNWVMRIVTHFDGGNIGRCLFPSYHCLASLYVCLSLRGRDDLPKWYHAANWIFAFLVCVCVLLTKQHYVVDVPAGLALAFIAWLVTEKLDPGARILRARGEKRKQNG